MSSSELTVQEFCCPVCRAKQTPQPVCRRCSADLDLLLRAYNRAEFVRHELSQEISEDARKQLQTEWELLGRSNK